MGSFPLVTDMIADHYDRDILDATMNYGAHISFAVKWAKILEKEEIESASK